MPDPHLGDAQWLALKCGGCGWSIFFLEKGKMGFGAAPGARLKVNTTPEGKDPVFTDFDVANDTCSAICPACGAKTPMPKSVLDRF